MTSIVGIDFIAVLPPEQAMEVFNKLDPTALARSCQVSRRWHALASNEALWRPLERQFFPAINHPPSALQARSNTTEQTTSFCLARTSEEIVQRAQEWIEAMQGQDYGRFRVRCLFDERCRINATIWRNPHDARAAPLLAMEQRCLYIQRLPSPTACTRQRMEYCPVGDAGGWSHQSILPQESSLLPRGSPDSMISDDEYEALFTPNAAPYQPEGLARIPHMVRSCWGPLLEEASVD